MEETHYRTPLIENPKQVRGDRGKKKTAGKGGKRQSLIMEVFLTSIALVFTNITNKGDMGYKKSKKKL